MEEYISIIAQFGFPIVMCLWFMFRTEKIITRNTEVIEKLNDLVTNLCKKRKI